MNSARQKKIERELESLEAELVCDLLGHLPLAADSGADLFCLARWNPNRDFVSSLTEKSQRCISLRETLGLGTARTVGERYMLAHNEASSQSSEHRRGPRRLAGWLLQELEAHNAI